MSPTEFDLRRALSDGEGDGVDAGLIIFAARERRARRRHAMLSAAAAVIVVGGIAGGIAALAGNSTDTGSASAAGSNSYAPNSVKAPPAGGSSEGGGADVASSAGSSAMKPQGTATNGFTCARRPLHLTLPGRGTPPQLGATGELLTGPVQSYRVCLTPFRMMLAQATPQSRPPLRFTVTGAAADALTASIQNASRTPKNLACPDIRTAESVVITIVPVSPSGKAEQPLVVSTPLPTCNTVITNGTSVRYNWQMPRRLQRLLDITAVGTGTAPSGSISVQPATSGAASGSPVH